MVDKELSLLEHLDFIRHYEIDDEHRTLNDDYACRQSLDVIETALKRLEELEIENSKQFKEKWVQDNLAMTFELNVAKKKLKVLEIIKDSDFSLEFDESQNEWFLYISDEKQNILVSKGAGIKTYDLLKEVLL